MNIYILLFLLVILLPLIIKSKKVYCVICTLILIAIVGFRAPQLGLNDTQYLYLPYFNNIHNLNFDGLIDFVKIKDTEFLFYFISQIFSKILYNEMWYLVFLSLPLYCALGYFIYKYSKYPSISFVLFISLNYFGMSFYVLRHCVAMAILMFAYEKLMNKKIKQYVLLTLFATLFHRTALVFLLLYLFSKLNFKIFSYSVFALLIFVVEFLVGNRLLSIIFKIFSSGHFSYYAANYDTGSLSMFISCFCILVFLEILIKNKKNANDDRSTLLINTQFLATILSVFCIHFDGFFRIASFFSIISVISVPYALSVIKDKNTKTLVSIVFIILLIIYFFGYSMINTNISPYSFYWEVM